MSLNQTNQPANTSPALPLPTKYYPGLEDNPVPLEIDHLPALAVACITAIGSENIYIVKAGIHYFCKVGNTSRYEAGMWDFAADKKMSPPIVITAYGAWSPNVPEGMVGVYATENGERDAPCTRWLVPVDEYQANRREFVIDPARHTQLPQNVEFGVGAKELCLSDSAMAA